MNIDEFTLSTNEENPPQNLKPELLSLWYDAKGNWNRAHNIADNIHSSDGAWVHAYLHRKEGDHWNADYWYRRAGRVQPGISLDKEWEYIVRALLEQN